MRKKALLIILLSFALWLPAGDDCCNCFTIIVGKKASADGSVLMAHNEDDSGRLLVNIHRVPAQERRRGDAITLREGAVLPYAGNTLAMLWLQLPSQDFGDTYVNGSGVAIASDSCPSREEKGELSEGGIGFNLRRLVAERAKTAREGVRVAGELISRYGYNSSGRTYIISDAREGWLLHAVKGKRWLARRVPDDEVAVIANRYTITTVDLSDKDHFQGSPDIIDYSIHRGWYDPKKDGEFDFARAYSDPGTYADMRNVLRQWRGTDLLAAKPPKLDAPLPFSFKPDHSVRPRDLFRVLRDHYEGTQHDASDRYRNGSPNAGKNRTICTATTQYAFVAHLRDWLPAEIGTVLWLSLRRPDSNAFSPWYPALENLPRGSSRESHDAAWKNHFNPMPPQALEDAALSFQAYAQLSEAVDRRYRENIPRTQKVWRNFEESLFDDLKDHEKEFVFLLKGNRDLALDIIANYVHGLEYRKRYMAAELLKEMK